VSDAKTATAALAALWAACCWFIFVRWLDERRHWECMKDAPPTFTELLAAGGTVK
jgi:hypothetical protein